PLRFPYGRAYPAPVMNITSLQRKKVAELQRIARDLDIQNYSHLRKEDLIYQILEANALADSEHSEDVAERPRLGVRRSRPAPGRRAGGGEGASRPEVPARARGQRPRRTERRGRSDRARQPISDEYPAYMRNFDPSKTPLEGMLRKVGVLEVLA